MVNTPPLHDVVILGGGLAGLTLAMQLKRREPDIDILVLERRAHPVPEAIHKIGESSVEIGAHYFDKVLGLGEHLRERQLRKFGFRFFFSEGRRDIDQVTEIGASRHLSVPSYQIDRGIFENFLAIEAQERGIRFVQTAMVRQVELTSAEPASQAPHQVVYEHLGTSHTVNARWIVDACGRAGLLKRKLNLAELNDHPAHAVWFRIKDRIHIDGWSDNTAWRARCDPQARWLSTNHLVGAGYWVWLIPLSSGSHSVGIVADPAIHPLATMDTFDKAMTWLEQYQPLLFDELDPKRDLLQDFAFFKRFSYGCKQVFSADRWALTGEAGLFLDPFYSPGSDFIAISNTYVTELIAMDRRGERLGARAQIFDQLFHSFYDSTMVLYQDQYPVWRPGSAAGQGDLGLHLLLGRAGPVLLPPAPDRPLIARRFAQRTGRVPANQRAGAGVPAPMVAGEPEAQPGGHARPGRDTLVRGTQPQPERRSGHRRLPGAHPRIPPPSETAGWRNHPAGPDRPSGPPGRRTDRVAAANR